MLAHKLRPTGQERGNGRRIAASYGQEQGDVVGQGLSPTSAFCCQCRLYHEKLLSQVTACVVCTLLDSREWES